MNKKATLTKREAQTIALICLGFDSTDTARLMGVSKRTVDFHLRNIFIKTPSYKSPRQRVPENRFELAHAWGYWGKPLDELRRIGAGMEKKNGKSRKSEGETPDAGACNSNVRDDCVVRGCTLRAD